MNKTCCFTKHRPPNLPLEFDEQDMRWIAPKRERCALLSDHK